MRVIDGDEIFSCSASSPIVCAPHRSSVPSTASWLRVRSSVVRSRRSRRARRITLVRNELASLASTAATAEEGIPIA